MANLFNLSDGKVIISPEMLLIPEMKVIWDKDKSKQKESAFRELSFVYFVSDFNSPYSSYPENKREQLVKEDYIRDKKWKPDADVLKAIEKYKQLSETPSMRLLKSVRGAVDRMAGYLDDSEIDHTTIKNILDTVTKAAAVISGQAKIEEAVKKEMASGARTRGDKEVGDYER